MNSFASNGECGLKPAAGTFTVSYMAQFIRQQWRMWIETSYRPHLAMGAVNSFASNGECGLKPDDPQSQRRCLGQFIRQQWRMWIETATMPQPGPRR